MATSKLEGIGLEKEQIEHIQVMLLDRGLPAPDTGFLYGLGPRDKVEIDELIEDGNVDAWRPEVENGFWL